MAESDVARHAAMRQEVTHGKHVQVSTKDTGCIMNAEAVPSEVLAIAVRPPMS